MKTKPKIILKDNVKNEEQIRTYWSCMIEAYENGKYGGAECGLEFLLSTGRISKKEKLSLTADFDKPLGKTGVIRRVTIALREDGDCTIWSDPPRVWLGEGK